MSRPKTSEIERLEYLRTGKAPKGWESYSGPERIGGRPIDLQSGGSATPLDGARLLRNR